MPTPRLIDRLLDSPHYGERWGRHWLDLARFAESHGYEQDDDRPTAYHYRDFVIEALNQDMPYDQFVRWQIAGDEYAPDNNLALMATGFLAAGTHATQITANQVEKERYDELDDMAATVGTAMLGLTIGCARCHDHKFDPIPQADYYRLVSTFTSTVRSEVDLDFHPQRTRERQQEYESSTRRWSRRWGTSSRNSCPAASRNGWPRTWSESGAKWRIVEATATNSEGGAEFTLQDDGSYLVSGTNASNDVYTFTVPTSATNITAVRIDAMADPSLPKNGPAAPKTETLRFRTFSSGPRLTVPTRPARPQAGGGQGHVPAGEAAGGGRHRRQQKIGLGHRSAIRQEQLGCFRHRNAHCRRQWHDAHVHFAV